MPNVSVKTPRQSVTRPSIPVLPYQRPSDDSSAAFQQGRCQRLDTGEPAAVWHPEICRDMHGVAFVVPDLPPLGTTSMAPHR
ncbi:MAG: hypothetical protein DWI22_19090 [Planctomycetota bacterium]|nr:MAG: hypothetical protein DWI22_19090 [Planctomycetota bacterium]